MIRYPWGPLLFLAVFSVLAWLFVVPHMEAPSPGLPGDVISLLVLTTVIPTNLFVIYYARLDWRASAVGRALMVKATGVALLVDLAVVSRFFGDSYPGRDPVRLTVFTILAVGLWYQFLVLLQTRRAFRRDVGRHGEQTGGKML